VDRDRLPSDRPLYFSSEDVGPDDAAELRGIAITRSPAMSCMPAFRFLPIGLADLDESFALRLRPAEPHLAGARERTRNAVCRRRFGNPIRVCRPAPTVEYLRGRGGVVDGELVAESRGGWSDRSDEGGPVGPLEIRPGGRVLRVH
jgi:hypothetical protein